MAKRKLPKRPRKPKANASLQTWQNFDQRVKDWKKKCSDIINGQKKKNALVKKYQSANW